MARSLFRDTITFRGPAGLIPLSGAAVRFYEPNGTGPPVTPIAYPLFPDAHSTTPLPVPYYTGHSGELELWSDLPHRVRLIVSKPGMADADEIIDLSLDPAESATDPEVAAAVAEHEAKDNPHDQYATDADLAAHETHANPHPQYLTEDEGDLRYLPLGYVPDLTNYYTKPQSDSRYVNTDVAGDTMLGPLAVPAVYVATKPVAVSPSAGNYLTWDTSGLYVPTPPVIPPISDSYPALDLRYLQLTGGTLTGHLGAGTDNLYDLGTQALRWRKLWTRNADIRGTLSFSGSSATDVYLYRNGAQELALQAHVLPAEFNNTFDLGSTSWRWRKLWGVDADLSGALAVGGTGTFGGPVTVPTPLTIQDITLIRFGSTDLRVNASFTPSTHNTRLLGAATVQWFALRAGFVALSGDGTASPLVGAAGAVRLRNGVQGNITWRNATNTGDLTLGTDASNNLLYNGNAFVTQAITDPLYVNVGGDSMSGPLNLTGPSTQHRVIYGQTVGSPRWGLILGTGETEAGANTGSDFLLGRYADNGDYLGTGLSINRATGDATLGGGLTATYLSAGGYIDTHGASAGIHTTDRSGSSVWVQYSVSNVLRFNNVTDKVWFDLDGTVHTAAGARPVKLSPDAGNVLEWRGNGIWATGVAGSGITQSEADLRYLQLTGGTTTGPVTINPSLTVNANTGEAALIINSQAGSNANLLWRTVNANRWGLFGSEFWWVLHDYGNASERLSIYNGTGTLNISPVGANDAIQARGSVGVNANAGTYRGLKLLTAGYPRWYVGTSVGAETGSNLGSDLDIYRYNDAGALLGTALSISRATGAATFGGSVSAPLFNVNASVEGANYVGFGSNLNAFNFDPNFGSYICSSYSFTVNLNSAGGSGGAFRVNSGARGMQAGTVLFAIDGTGLVQMPYGFTSGAATFGGAVTATSYTVNGLAGTGRDISFRSNNGYRWILRAEEYAETGSNAGSDMALYRYDDSGNYLGLQYRMTRATGETYHPGAATFGGAVTAPEFASTNVLRGTNLYLQAGAGGDPYIFFRNSSGQTRWTLFGNYGAETGSNAGGDLGMHRYNDAGTYLGQMLMLSRATGKATFGGQVEASGSFITTQGLRVEDPGVGVGAYEWYYHTGSDLIRLRYGSEGAFTDTGITGYANGALACITFSTSGASTLAGSVRINRPLVADTFLEAFVGAEANPRVRITGGKLWFGIGSGVPEAGISRVTSNTLGPDGNWAAASTNAYDLGTSALRWRNLFLGTQATIGTANTAAAGAVRLQNTATLAWRNAGNTADLTLGVDASDQFVFNGAAPLLNLKRGAEAQPRAMLGEQGLYAGPGGSTGVDVMLVRTAPLTWTLHGHMQTGTTNTYDLGATGNRYRKLWATDADLSGSLVTGGSVGVGVTPAAWGSSWRAIQVGNRSALWDDSVGTLYLNQNSYHDGTNFRALATAASTQVRAQSTGTGYFAVAIAPSVAAGAAQTFTDHLAVNGNGTTVLSPAANQWGVIISGGIRAQGTATQPEIGSNISFYSYDGSKTGYLSMVASGGMNIASNTGALMLHSTGTVAPLGDNSLYFGDGTHRWMALFAVAGSINTSTAEMKQDITPLDPAACYQAAKDVVWYEFAYLPPAYTAPEPPPDIAYDAADDNETKAKKKSLRDEAEAQAKAAHLKMVAETAPARNQRGFVFPAGAESKDEAGGTLPPVPALFGLSDRESTTPQADLATLGCALQEVIRRLEALEGAAA